MVFVIYLPGQRQDTLININILQLTGKPSIC